MTTRVTITLPDDLQRTIAAAAERTGRPFSAVVADALAAWARGQLVDAFLAEHQAEHGEFGEEELRVIAAEAGVPYVPPASNSSGSAAA